MNWAYAGLAYAAVYVAVVLAIGDRPDLRLLVGNMALLLPPIAPLAVLAGRRRAWIGRQAVFCAALGAWALLWLIGQLAWFVDEIGRGMPLPWFKWHIILQLCGSALPLIALVAWPHRGARTETAVTAAVDVSVLTFLTGFVYWSLIIAPGMDPAHRPMAMRALAIIGPLVRLAAVAGLLLAVWKSRGSAWAEVYQRLAIGMLLAFAILVGLSWLTLNARYQTGSASDIGWMIPFWFSAWALATAPSSDRFSALSIADLPAQHSSPALLLVAIVAVPIVGYGARQLVPLGQALDSMRDAATATTLIAGIALVVVRLRVEQRAVDLAHQRLRLLASACEQSGELIVITSSGHVEYANDAFCRATGYSRDELATLPAGEIVAPESRSEVPGLRDRLRAARSVRATTVMKRKDGTTFHAEWSAAIMSDPADRVTRVVAVVRDLTEELRLRDQLVRGERLSAVGELVSGVAHEINNPLQSVIGTLELLLRDLHDARMREDLERARNEAGRAGRIIRNLLFFVRRSPAERLLTDVNEIVKSVVSVRAYDLSQSNIELRELYGPNLPVVLANRDEIQQVVLNLVMNAQHAMVSANGGGMLTVRTYVKVDHAVIEVTDDGPGVAPELAGRIFEPFFTTKSVGSGTGLGLSLAFGIANAHGGKLELVPTSVGACFRLSLPSAGFPGPVHVH